NRRSVWNIATQPYPEAHFATFPEKLVEPCILAGTSAEGCCPASGAPWERVVEKGELKPVRGNLIGPIEDWQKKDGSAEVVYNATKNMVRTDEGFSLMKREHIMAGWAPTCGSPYERVVEKVATGKIRQRATGGLGTAIRREPQGLSAV